MMIKCLESFPPDIFVNEQPEDGWYVQHLPLIGARVAPFGIARQFASERYCMNTQAIGFHQLPPRYAERVQDYCPEINLVKIAA